MRPPTLGGMRGLPILGLAMLLLPGLLYAAEPGFTPTLIEVRIPVEFILFALTLLGVALFHHYTLQVALTGLADHHGLQACLHRLQVRARVRRAGRRTWGTSG